jgi:hypothetical protein
MLRGSRAVQLNAVPWGNHYSGFFLPQVIWSVLEFHINGIPLYVVSCVFSFTWQNVFDIQPCCVFRCLFLLFSSVPLWGSIPVYLSTLLWKDIWVIFSFRNYDMASSDKARFTFWCLTARLNSTWEVTISVPFFHSALEISHNKLLASHAKPNTA